MSTDWNTVFKSEAETKLCTILQKIGEHDFEKRVQSVHILFADESKDFVHGFSRHLAICGTKSTSALTTFQGVEIDVNKNIATFTIPPTKAGETKVSLNLAPGTILTCDHLLVVFGPNGLNPHQEMELTMRRLIKKFTIPILLPNTRSTLADCQPVTLSNTDDYFRTSLYSSTGFLYLLQSLYGCHPCRAGTVDDRAMRQILRSV